MPELPEVETIRRQLVRELKNKRIKKVEVRLPKMVKGSVEVFKKYVVGQVIGFKRRAKVLIIQLSNNYSVLVHLKMTGQLVIVKKKKVRSGGHPIKDGSKDLPNKYSHVIFYFTDGSILYFNDMRRFGYVRLVSAKDYNKVFNDFNFGPEPLSESFTLSSFKELIGKKKSGKIKPLLLDQKFIAGIGNIYAVESCFRAGINPVRDVKSLKPKEIEKLYKAIRYILSQAVRKQGTSSKNYVDAYGQPGEYVPLLKVYSRQGKPCYKCHTKIASITMGSRSTAYCPKCQK